MVIANNKHYYCHIYFLITMIMIFTTSCVAMPVLLLLLLFVVVVTTTTIATTTASVAPASYTRLHWCICEKLSLLSPNSFRSINLSDLSFSSRTFASLQLCWLIIFFSSLSLSLARYFFIFILCPFTTTFATCADLSIFKFNQLKIAYK